LVRLSPLPAPLGPLPTPLKATARGFIVLFHVCIWGTSTIFPHLHLLHSPFSLPTSTSHTYTVPILQSYLSVLIPKSMSKGISQCIPTANMLYFGQFNFFHYSLLFLPFHPPLFNSFQYISLYPLYSTRLMLCHSLFLFLLS
jgi:hypothetical protein